MKAHISMYRMLKNLIMKRASSTTVSSLIIFLMMNIVGVLSISSPREFFSISPHFSSLIKQIIPSSYAEKMLSEAQLFREVIEQGTSAYKRGEYQAAIQHFEGALMVRSNPNIHWNLSVCHHKLGHYKEALFHANEYLEKGSPSMKMRAKVEKRKKEILRLLQQVLLRPKDGERSKDQSEFTSTPSLPNTETTLPPPYPYDQPPVATKKVESSLTPVAPSSSAKRTQRNYSKTIIWASLTAALLGGSVGLHLYGDSSWANRPSGGGQNAESARRKALLYSWMGDGLLVLSMASLALTVNSYMNSTRVMVSSACTHCTLDQGLRQSAMTIEHPQRESRAAILNGTPMIRLLSHSPQSSRRVYHGGLLGWRLTF